MVSVAPLWTPPIPPVANTSIPARPAIIDVAATVVAIAVDTVADVRVARHNVHRHAPALARAIATEPAVRHARRRVPVHARAVAKVLAHRYAHADARLVVLAIQDNSLWTLQRKKPLYGMRA